MFFHFLAKNALNIKTTEDMQSILKALDDDFEMDDTKIDWKNINLDALACDMDWDDLGFQDAMDDVIQNPINPEDITISPLTHIPEDLSDDEENDVFEDALDDVKQVRWEVFLKYQCFANKKKEHM